MKLANDGGISASKARNMLAYRRGVLALAASEISRHHQRHRGNIIYHNRSETALRNMAACSMATARSVASKAGSMAAS